jgi:hypothetical protein
MKALAIELDTGKLSVKNHGHYLVTGNDFIDQNLIVTLRFWYGEWFLDTTLGIKYKENILIKNPNIPAIQSMLKSAILGAYGIKSIEYFIMDYSSKSRSLVVTFSYTRTDLTINNQTVGLP